MQKIVFDEPYRFVKPVRHTLWSRLLKSILPWYMRKTHGIVDHDVRGLDHLKQSFAAGRGVMLTANHSRLSDPMSFGFLARDARCHLYAMASWHTFKNHWLAAFLLRRVGAFSIYREGPDRQSIEFAVNALVQAERGLIIFPEGYATRKNEIIATLQEGFPFIARRAAKIRSRATPSGEVVIHPVAIVYEFLGDLSATIEPLLTDLEARLSWHPHRHLPPRERILHLGRALLTLKELEYLGHPQSGRLRERQERLVEHMLGPLEAEWLGGRREENVIARVKALRSAILPDMVANRVSEEERARRWRYLATAYYAQAIATYPQDYLHPDSPPERLLEIAEKLEDEFTDHIRPLGPLKMHFYVDEAIVVPPDRSPRGERDPLIGEVHERLQARVSELVAEIASRRAGPQAAGLQSHSIPAEIQP